MQKLLKNDFIDFSKKYSKKFYKILRKDSVNIKKTRRSIIYYLELLLTDAVCEVITQIVYNWRRMKRQMHIKVVMYVRTSTTDQEGGLETQIDVLNKRIEAVGWRNIVETFVDEAIPGDSEVEDRPGFKAMLIYIENYNKENPKNTIKEVWVQTRDRIARDVDIMGYVSVILRRIGVKISSTEEDNGTLTRRIHDALGEEELKKYREKRNQGIERRLGQQKIMSRVPMGYKVENGRMIVDEEIRQKIEELFAMLHNDNIEMSTISTKFNISRSTLAYMRRNPIYTTGEYYWKGKVKFHVEPIYIPKEED